VAKDEKQALGWYLKAAEAKQAWSMGQLARMYEGGVAPIKIPRKLSVGGIGKLRLVISGHQKT